MARITVEDCLQNEPNLFNLVLLAAKRARRLANGAEATVEWENDKPTVVALREIAAGNITLEMLEEPEEPAQPPVSELDMPSDFRAPQLGLGDYLTPAYFKSADGLCVFNTRFHAWCNTLHRSQPHLIQTRHLSFDVHGCTE